MHMAERRFSEQAVVANCSETEDFEDSSSFDSLPNDVVANILLRLPAKFLPSSARYVNRTWAEISQHPSFIKSHLLHSSECGFLIQDSHSPYKVQSIHSSDYWELKETNLHSKFPGKIRGSSDGVLLFNKSGSGFMDLYVANPVTMQTLKLPTLPSSCRLCSHCNNIARISSTGEIKVISLGKDSNNGMYSWYVLKLGKEMSWRKISSSSVPEECDPASYLSYVQSLSVNGVVYWTNSSWITNQSVLAIDLGDESVHHLKVPTECHGQYWTLVQMGMEICCMNCGNNVEMKVWKLKDFRTKEWVMVKSIKFSDEIPLGRNFVVPLIWVDLEVLVLSVYVEASNVVVAYHANKGEYKAIKIGDVARHAIFQHTQSLIRF